VGEGLTLSDRCDRCAESIPCGCVGWRKVSLISVLLNTYYPQEKLLIPPNHCPIEYF
jgi:hypothetical protein